MNEFEEIEIDNDPQEPKPKFDPKKPFQAVNGKPAFDPNKPFEEEKKKAVSTFSVENFSQGLKPSYNTSSPTKLKSQEQGVSERDLMGAPKSLLAEPQFSRNPNTLLDPEFEAKIEETNKPFNEFQSRVIGKRVGTANGDIYTPIDFDTNKREAYPRIEQFKQGDIVKDDTSPTGYKAFHFNEQTQQWQFDPIVAPKKISGENAEVVVRAFAPKKDKEVLKKETQELVQNDKPLGEFLKNSDSKLLDEKLLANPAFAKTLSQVTSETPTQTRTADGRMDLYEKAIIKHYKLDVDPFVKYPTVDHATFQKNLVDINKAKPTFDEIKNLSNQAKQLQAKFELSGNKDAKAASDYEKTVAKIKELQGQVQPLLDYFSDDFVSEVLHLQGLQERGQQEYDSALNYFPNYKKSVVEAENRKLEDTSLLGDIGRSLGTGALNLITDVLYTGTQLTPSYFPGVDDWVDKTKDKYDMWARAKGSTGKHGDFGNFLIGASKLAPQATAIILTKNPRLASGLWVAAPTWGSSYKESLSQGLSESEAMAKATVDAGIEVFSESLVKDRSMLKGFKPSKELRELGLREFGSPAFNKQMVGELNQFKKGLVSETIIDVGGQFVEEVAALKSGQITNEITNALANTDFQTEAAGDEERHLLGQVALLTVGMKALGGSYKTPSKKSYRDVILYDAAKNENWEGTRRIIESLKAEEGIDPEYVAQLEKDLTQMAGMKFPEKVTPEQKVVLLEEVNKLRELEAKKEGVEKELQSDINEKIKEQKDKIEKIQHSPKLAKEMLDESTSKASEKIQEIAKENPEFQEQANQLTRQEGTVQPTPSVQSDENNKDGIGSEEWDNANPLHQKITDVLKANGFEVENESSGKSFSEYIKVPIRDDKGNVDYRLKIRVSDHSLPRGGSLANADIRTNKNIQEAIDIIKNSRGEFKDLKIPKPNQGTTPERSVATDVDAVVEDGNKTQLTENKNAISEVGGETKDEREVTHGVIGRVGKFVSRVFGGKASEKVYVAKDEKSLIDKANELQKEGGDVKYLFKEAVIGALAMLQPMKVNQSKAVRTEQTTRFQSKDERAVVDILKRYYKENDETPPEEVIDRALYLWNKFGRPEILPDSTSKDERAFATNEDGKIKIGNITNFDDFIAELSHSAQYVSGKKMDDRQYATQEERDKVEYERKGSMEYKAHKEVEPILAKYIFTGDSVGLNKIQYHKKEGNILGFTHKGKIYLNGENLNPETPIHEAGHIWTEWTKQNDTKLYNKGIELINGSKYLKAIKEDKFYQAEANKLPASEREQYFKHEALAQAIGDKGAKFVSESKKTGFKEWLNNLWSNIKDAAGFKDLSNKEFQNLTLDEFSKRAAKDILDEQAANPKTDQSNKPINSSTEKEGEPKEGATEDVPPAEPPKGEVAGKGEKDGVGITHADTKELREEKGLPEYIKEAQTVEKWKAEATERIKKGELPALLDKMKRGETISDVEQMMMGQHIANLDAELSKNPTKENLDKLNEAVELSDKAGGSAWGRSGRARQETFLPDDSLGTFLKQKEAAQGVPLTEAQVKSESAKYEELKKAKEDLEKLLIQEREQHAKDITELGFNKARAKAKRDAKKSSAEYKEERKSIVTSIKDKWKKAGQDNKLSSDIPFRKQFSAIAPDVKKLAESLINEGIDKFDNLVTALHAELKDAIDGIRKTDIIDILAGEHDVKPEKKTRDEIAAQARLLQKEAKLVRELAEARKGEQKAKTESVKVEKSRRIKELEVKIKEVKKLNKESEEGEPVEDASISAEERTNKQVKKLLTKAAKLSQDIREGNFAKEVKEPKPFVKSKKLQAAEDKVMDLENKIRHERSKEEYNKRSKARKFFDRFMEVLGLRRLIQTALDMSIPFRQGVTLFSPRRIDIWAKGFMANLKSVFSPKRFERIMHGIRNDPMYHEMVKDGVVFNDLGSADPNLHNEDFRKSFFYKIPLLSEPVKASNRSADAFLNVARLELYKKMRGVLEKKGLTREADPKAFKFIGNWTMNMTGRGHMLNALENSKAQFLLGNTFYGARLMASRFNLLNPVTYFDPRIPKEARYEAMKDMAAFSVTIMAVGAALAAAGGAISLDPDDSDFLQIRFGDNVYDISGGLVAYIRTFLRIAKAGYTKATETKYEGKKATENAGMSVLNFFRNKLSPNTSYGADLFFGKRYGEEFDKWEIVKIYPMYADDALKALKEDGVVSLATVLLPNVLGVGYGNYASKGQIDATLEDLKERNMRSDEMNNEKIYNYKDGGRQVTDKEFENFADKRDKEIEIGLEEMFKNGIDVVVNREVVKKPYKEMTPEEVTKETNSIKAAATAKVKKEMFGEKVKTIDEEIDEAILESHKEVKKIQKEYPKKED